MKMQTMIGVGLGVLAVHIVLSELRKKEPAIYYLEKLPGNYNGMTIPPVGIIIKADQAGNTELLDHEIVHWRQFQRMGLFPYYFNYMKGYLQQGYDKHPMEREARISESSYCRENYTECVRSGTAKTVFNPNFRKLI